MVLGIPAAHSINNNERFCPRRLPDAPRDANSAPVLLHHPKPKRGHAGKQPICLFRPHARSVVAKHQVAVQPSIGQRVARRIEVYDGLAVCRDLITRATVAPGLADKSFDHNGHPL